MKRVLCYILVLVLIFSMAGCSTASNSNKKSEKFYYCTNPVSYGKETSVVSPEIREFHNHNGNTISIINEYLAGPISDKYSSPFPSGVRVISISERDRVVTICLSSQFSTLTDMRLTIAAACLSLTIFDLLKAESVIIQTDGELLNGKPSIQIDKNSLIMIDQYIIGSE